jgi:hypothetical protein
MGGWNMQEQGNTSFSQQGNLPTRARKPADESKETCFSIYLSAYLLVCLSVTACLFFCLSAACLPALKLSDSACLPACLPACLFIWQSRLKVCGNYASSINYYNLAAARA